MAHPVLFAIAASVCLLTSVRAAAQTAASAPQLKVFLDCSDCYRDFLETEVEFVDYVRDRSNAAVHVLLTRAETAGGGQEFTMAFVGLATLQGIDRTLKTVTARSDTDDVIRRQLATTLRVGLLHYVTQDGVPQQLDVSVELGSEQSRPAVVGDRWNNWVMSLEAQASFSGEESSNQREIGSNFSADRITPEWKITFGLEIDHEREEFDLDEDEPVEVERRERDFNWLVVKGLGEHWSIGAQGEVESSTFENIKMSVAAAPAIEYNFFPYSAYTRRQFRTLYSIGGRHNRYYEETLYGKFEETLPVHELSLTYEQRERWGTLLARSEWSQYLHDLDKLRLETEAQVSIRIARGLSVQGELNASRIRDQISLPARGATPEEVLLRLRELESGYEYGFSMGITYTFGSIFSSIVNPRFGQ